MTTSLIDSGKTCYICLDPIATNEFEKGLQLRKAACDHCFHDKCIEKRVHLLKLNSCPVCYAESPLDLSKKNIKEVQQFEKQRALAPPPRKTEERSHCFDLFERLFGCCARQ